MSGLLQCTKCGTPLAENQINQRELTLCAGCGARIQADVFPALFRPQAPGREGEALLVDNEASCFFHPKKKAVLPCEACGRFLCALCDCELQSQHFCPSCLETGRQKGKIKRLEYQRMRYDSVALALAICPLLIFYFTILTAPIALYVALRYWNAPRSLVYRTKWRLVLAIVIATLEIGGWAVGAYFLTSSLHIGSVQRSSNSPATPSLQQSAPTHRPGLHD